MLQATENTKSENWQIQKLCPLTIKATKSKNSCLGVVIPYHLLYNLIIFSKMY